MSNMKGVGRRCRGEDLLDVRVSPTGTTARLSHAHYTNCLFCTLFTKITLAECLWTSCMLLFVRDCLFVSEKTSGLCSGC